MQPLQSLQQIQLCCDIVAAVPNLVQKHVVVHPLTLPSQIFGQGMKVIQIMRQILMVVSPITPETEEVPIQNTIWELSHHS